MICSELNQGATSVSVSASSVVFICSYGECGILLCCHFAICFMTMVVCIVVRLVFIYCTVIMSGFVLIFVVDLVY